VTYLLDVNALLALAHAAHVHHGRMEVWVCSLSRRDRLATCAITELGFVRIAPQVRLSPDVAAARALLSVLRRNRRRPFVRLSDELGADSLPSWVRTPAQTTDGHLVALAAARDARLATLDEAIPDAVRVP
jgi:predicted nucleic acid-binding protein